MKLLSFFFVNLICLPLVVVAELRYVRDFCTGFVLPRVVTSLNKREIYSETDLKQEEFGSVSTGREWPIPRYLSRHNITLEAEQLLELLAQQLATFVHEFDFDAAQFETQAQILRRKVAGLTSWVEVMFLKNRQIMARLEFLHRMFCTLNSAAAYLRYFTSERTEQQLLRSLIQLNVRLLSLYNFRGEPDLLIPRFAEYVTTFSRRLDIWADMNDKLQAVPVSVRIMVKAQFDDSRAILQHLASYIPKELN
ncbi:hypothetical protein HF325_006323 [Metschnikowia pulcherrima]|uniref:Uncharacterized protein n=1 Tax=Metschnikowia pulcherrima TaxID=27326 RepID=A0A8H7GND2_9ASCO|nr:hypothetical protein HF325_006323 [Metschnikowia pulcherrima]